MSRKRESSASQLGIFDTELGTTPGGKVEDLKEIVQGLATKMSFWSAAPKMACCVRIDVQRA
jgi:hypothetical protein